MLQKYDDTQHLMMRKSLMDIPGRNQYSVLPHVSVSQITFIAPYRKEDQGKIIGWISHVSEALRHITSGDK